MVKGLIAVVLSVFFSSCSLFTESDYRLFRVEVDSLNVPSSISQNDTLPIWLYGIVGTNGCYSFSHFEAERETYKLMLSVWGRWTKATACPDVMVYLHEKYSVFPLPPGFFYIEIQQPDGSTLMDTVIVR